MAEPAPYGIETWKEKLCWMALGAIVGAIVSNLPGFLRWIARRARLMPRPIIDRVWIIRGKDDDDQWVKARARLSRWRWVGNDSFFNCSVEAVRDGDDTPVGLLVAGTPEPMASISFRPGDAYEIQVAIWLPRKDTVGMSRSLKFELAAYEPRLLSSSLCYGIVDRTAPIPDGRNKLRLRLREQGRMLSELAFTLTVDRAVGFQHVSLSD